MLIELELHISYFFFFFIHPSHWTHLSSSIQQEGHLILFKDISIKSHQIKVQHLRNEIESACGILMPNELIFQPFYGGASFTFTKHFPSVVKVTWWRWQQVITALLCRVIVMGGLETRFQYTQHFGWDFFLKILSLYFICFPALQEGIWLPTHNERVPTEHSWRSFWARKAPDPTLQSILASTSRVKVQGCIFWYLLLYCR